MIRGVARAAESAVRLTGRGGLRYLAISTPRTAVYTAVIYGLAGWLVVLVIEACLLHFALLHEVVLVVLVSFVHMSNYLIRKLHSLTDRSYADIIHQKNGL